VERESDLDATRPRPHHDDVEAIAPASPADQLGGAPDVPADGAGRQRVLAHTGHLLSGHRRADVEGDGVVGDRRPTVEAEPVVADVEAGGPRDDQAGPRAHG
jgi:hypothetical protein